MGEHQEKEKEIAALAQFAEGIRKRQAIRPTCISCMHCMYNDVSLAQGMGECWYNPPVPVIVGPPDKLGRIPRQGIRPPVNLQQERCGHIEVEKLVKPSALEVRTFEKAT